MNRKENKRKRFICIAKVKDRSEVKFVKYRYNNFESLISFLQRQYEVYWVNCYNNVEPSKGKQVASWTLRNGFTAMI